MEFAGAAERVEIAGNFLLGGERDMKQLAGHRIFFAAIVTATLFAGIPHAMSEVITLQSQGGVLILPIKINDAIVLNFTLDSGAADVSIPADVASTLLRTGTLTTKDFRGEQKYQLANGEIEKNQIVILRKLQVGKIILFNVVASVTDARGSLLLGQSFLARLKNWSIDNATHQFSFTAPADSRQVIAQPEITSTTEPDTSVFNECAEPSPPVPIDGSSASADSMRAQHDEVIRYMATSDAYQQCILSKLNDLKNVAAANPSGPPVNPETVQMINARIDTNQRSKERVGAEFNNAVIQYKQTH